MARCWPGTLDLKAVLLLQDFEGILRCDGGRIQLVHRLHILQQGWLEEYRPRQKYPCPKSSSMHKITKAIGELPIKGQVRSHRNLEWLTALSLGRHSLKLQQSKLLRSQVQWGTFRRESHNKTETIPCTSTKPRACLCLGCRDTDVLTRKSKDQ